MLAIPNKPSSLIHKIQLEKVGNLNLFKFSESLQLRMENLLEKKKADQLTTDEIVELGAIGELDRIFTHANALLAAHRRSLLIPLGGLALATKLGLVLFFLPKMGLKGLLLSTAGVYCVTSLAMIVIFKRWASPFARKL